MSGKKLFPAVMATCLMLASAGSAYGYGIRTVLAGAGDYGELGDGLALLSRSDLSGSGLRVKRFDRIVGRAYDSANWRSGFHREAGPDLRWAIAAFGLDRNTDRPLYERFVARRETLVDVSRGRAAEILSPVSGLELNTTAVPLPAGAMLFASALAGLAGIRKRMMRRSDGGADIGN